VVCARARAANGRDDVTCEAGFESKLVVGSADTHSDAA
jgi:hypothetical protein